MPEFMLHHTHKAEDCGWAFHDLETNSHLPPGTTFFCTCSDVDHGGYFQVEAASAQEALAFLPESMRHSTNVIVGETLIVVGPEKAGELPAVHLESGGEWTPQPIHWGLEIRVGCSQGGARRGRGFDGADPGCDAPVSGLFDGARPKYRRVWPITSQPDPTPCYCLR